MAEYRTSSPYAKTATFDGKFLDLLNWRAIPNYGDDILTRIAPQYHNRPDLMAADLYGDSMLWWVFVVRNPDVIQDPIWDFTSDKTIYIPKLSTLQEVLGQ